MTMRITISLRREKIADKIDKKIEDGEYRNRSHAIEMLLTKALDIEETREPIKTNVINRLL